MKHLLTMTAIFALIASAAVFIQLASGAALSGTLSADSRPESSSGSCGSSCKPFAGCLTWSSDASHQLTYYNNPIAVSPDPPSNVKVQASSTTGYGYDYWMPWTSSNAVSGLLFAGHVAQTITFNSWFPVAKLSHVNFPISSSIHVCNKLNLNIPFYLSYTDSTGTSTTSTSFPVAFTVEETPNNACDSSYHQTSTPAPSGWQNAAAYTCPYGPTVTSTCQNACKVSNSCPDGSYCSANGNNYYSCKGCSDRVSISGGYTDNKVLTLAGKKWFMAVLGFTKSSSFSASDTPIVEMITIEQETTTGYLYARLVQTCTSNSDCDDGVACTMDQCLLPSSSLNTGGYTNNFCYYSFNNSLCSNSCGGGTCSSTGCTYSTTCGYIAPVINCMTCSSSTGTCLVSLGYQVSGTLQTDSTGVVSINPTSVNNFFTVNGVTQIDLGQPRNFYAGTTSSQVYSAGYVTVSMNAQSTVNVTWTLSGITVSLTQTTQCSNWGSCVTPTTPTASSLFSSVSSYLAVNTTASTYTFWYSFTVSSQPKCLTSSSGVVLQSLVVKVPTCSNGLTILSTTDGCYNSARANGGTYLTSNIVDSTISGASCLFNTNDGNMGFNGYDGFDIPLNNVGAGQSCLIGLQINYQSCPNVGWSAANSVTSSGRVSFVTDRTCTETCGLCNTLPLFGPLSTTCAGSQPSCTSDYQYLDSSSCTCKTCSAITCSQNYQMDKTCTCVPCSAPSCPNGQQPSSNYCDNKCIACSDPCSCSASDSNCYQRVDYTNSQCGACVTCPTKVNYTITTGSPDCSYTKCITSSSCDTNYYTYPPNLCDSCVPCDSTAIAATCGPNKTNSGHSCFCTPCTQTTCADGSYLANPYSTCNTTCLPCPSCPGNYTYADTTKKCTNGGSCLKCPYKACADGYAPDPSNLCNCIACPACVNSTRTNNTWSCDCTSCDKGCSSSTSIVNGIDCTHGCTDPNNLCSDCVKCPEQTCAANTTLGTNYCLGCQPCNVTCSAGQIKNPLNSCVCVTCSSSPAAAGYVGCPTNSSLNTTTCTCQPCTAPSCPAPSQANYADSCNTTCKTCSLSISCPANQTWDGVSYCNPCINCPDNTTNCPTGFVFVPSTQNNVCPKCANCSNYYSTTCGANETRSSDPCVDGCFPCPIPDRYANYQVNWTDVCQPLYECVPGVNVPACGGNQTVNPLDSCLCKDCPEPTCPKNYEATGDYCQGCVECVGGSCSVNYTRGDDTCNDCSPCSVPSCPASSHPNWDNVCLGCVLCDKAATVCPVNKTVNLADTCNCMDCPDPRCTGDFRYNSSNSCDGCTYCPLPECEANWTRAGLTSNCKPCYPCTIPTCPTGQLLTLQTGGCPYCATCVSGENVPACAFGYRVNSTDSCLCEQCTAPVCGGNETRQDDPCLPCLKCPEPDCTANFTSLDYCDGCTPCTTVCTAGSVYTNPLDICEGCTPCPLPSCGYGLEVADDLCSCTACPIPTCSAGFELDTTNGCGCVSCSNITCPLGTVVAADLCSCEVLTISNQPNVTTTRCNSTDRDACGVCYGNNRTCLGCDGQIGSGRYVDACGVVCGTGTTCAGCTGDSCSICTSKVDLCGVCGGNSSTCDGCDGVAASGAVYDICGVCAGNGTACLGCYGVPFGPACSNAISPGEAAAVSVLVALAALGALVLALIAWRMRSRPEILFQEWDNLIAEHLTEIQANPIFTSNETEVNPIFGQGHHGHHGGAN